jgi:hypothetical protein
LSWVVEGRGVRVLDEVARHAETLDYPAAALWELLLRGHDSGEAAAMLSWISGVPVEQARDEVAGCVRRWRVAGWLQAATPGTGRWGDG